MCFPVQRDIAMLFLRTPRLLVLEQLCILTQVAGSITSSKVDHKAALRSPRRILKAFCVLRVRNYVRVPP